MTHPPPRVAFSTLAFPDATLASALSLGRRWGYAGVELRLIDGELIDPSMSPAERTRVKQALAGLPVVAVDSSIRLTDDEPGPNCSPWPTPNGWAWCGTAIARIAWASRPPTSTPISAGVSSSRRSRTLAGG